MGKRAAHCDEGSCCYNANECDGNNCWLKAQGVEFPTPEIEAYFRGYVAGYNAAMKTEGPRQGHGQPTEGLEIVTETENT